MNRRKLMKLTVAGPLLASAAKREARAQTQVAQATRGMRSPKIKDIKAVYTAPGRVPLAVVKVTTDQDGLYGWGCASFTLRVHLVAVAVEGYLKPLLIGKPADRIEDIWQASYASSYWRNGPVLNNAISGVDQALWDIKARQAGMPVYQLLGGKAREAAACYSHAQGAEITETMRA
jgi:mannonate dehydratase